MILRLKTQFYFLRKFHSISLQFLMELTTKLTDATITDYK